MAKVFLKERKARPFWFGHPWVFSGAVDRVRGQLKDGCIVELCDHEGRTIGQGFYNSKSQIRVRLVALIEEGALDEELLLQRLDRAIALREQTLRLGDVANSYRIVHSEGDGLTGLIADKVGDFLVIQVSALGIVPFLDALIARLATHYRPRGIFERTSRVGIEEEGLIRTDGLLLGEEPEGAIEVTEHGVRYLADIQAGQKTGWYSDQRDNRSAVAAYAKDKRVLDAFSYTGGFGLQCAAKGAESVLFLDSSGPALQLAEQAAAQSGTSTRFEFREANVLRDLEHQARAGHRYDLVTLDPPKLVFRRADLKKGLKLYHEINEKGVAMVEDQGLLATFSCSQHVLDQDFDEMLGSVAKASGVRLQELERFTQAPDHPVLLPLEESRYLKGRLLRVHRFAHPDAGFRRDFGAPEDPAAEPPAPEDEA